MEAMMIILMAGVLASGAFALSQNDDDASDLDEQDDTEPDDPEGMDDLLDTGSPEDEDTSESPSDEPPGPIVPEEVVGEEVPVESDEGNHPADPTIEGQDGELIFGEDGNDVLSGGMSNDTISAGDGNDTLYGNDGNDLLDGRANLHRDFDGGTYQWWQLTDDGSDVLFGGDGDDTLGISNGDLAYGGTGADQFVVYSNPDLSSADIPEIRDFEPTLDTLRIVIELGPSDSDEGLGEYLGGGEFDYQAEVICRVLQDGSGTLVSVDGLPRVLITGSHEVDPNLVEVRAFLSE